MTAAAPPRQAPPTAEAVRHRLDIASLRARFARYTHQAYAALPPRERPRVLDLGCGRGSATLELARLTDGEILGIDVDAEAIATVRGRLEAAGLSPRVRAQQASLLDPREAPDGFLAGARFDLLWEEGVIHILDVRRALERCAALLKDGGHLVCCETVRWLEAHLDAYTAARFELVHRVPWEPGCWWTEYYAPLERRLARLRAELAPSSPKVDALLAPYEAEVAQVKANPHAFDCGHFIFVRARGQGERG